MSLRSLCRIPAIVPLIICCLTASAVQASASAVEVLAAEQVLRRGNGPEVETLDPHKAQSVSASNILRDLYEGLVGEAPDGRLRPGAAASWEISRDGLRYSFRMRADARWSNGDPVTAEDFAAGLRRSVDPATGSKYSQILAPIENAESVIAGDLPPEALGVEAPEPHTLIIRLESATPYFLGLLTHASAYPIHQSSLKQHGDAFAKPGNLVGNGAYRLTERVVQSHVLLEQNPHYWDHENGHIRQVYFMNTEDVNSEFKRFRAGELDWTSTIPSNQARWIRKNLPQQVRVSTYLGVYYYGFNVTQPPFKDNPALRHALSLAIDRQVIANKVLSAGEQVAYGWVPPGVIGYDSLPLAHSTWTREQRLAEARRLYAEAGYSQESPAEVEILYNTSEDHKKIAIVIGAMWKQFLGVRTKLRNEEWKVYLQSRQLKAKTQAFRAGWIGDYNDPNTFLEIMHSQHGLNDSGYASERFDTLLEAAAREGDAQKRMSLMQQAEAQLLEDMPVMPLYFYVTKRLVQPYVVGWQANIMDHHRTHDMRILEH